MTPVNLEAFEGISPGPWAWQLFGDTYSLTAQHGRREQIINAIKHGKLGYPVVAMNHEGRLRDVDPEWPNAKALASVPDLIAEVKALRHAMTEVLREFESPSDDLGDAEILARTALGMPVSRS